MDPDPENMRIPGIQIPNTGGMFSLVIRIIYCTKGTNKVLVPVLRYLENIGGLDEAETLVGGLKVVQRLPHVALQQTMCWFYVGFLHISSKLISGSELLPFKAIGLRKGILITPRHCTA
jgi:hypothetical protein